MAQAKVGGMVGGKGQAAMLQSMYVYVVYILLIFYSYFTMTCYLIVLTANRIFYLLYTQV